MAFVPRLTAPTDFTTYYNEKRRNPVGCVDGHACGTLTYWNRSYSGEPNWEVSPDRPPHTGNCTWYAYGRASELAGKSIYDEFYAEGNANNWANATWNGKRCAQTSGLIEYKLGDILIYKNSSDTAGHVEVVEEIKGNTLTISYSGYSSYTPQSEYGTWFNVRKRSKMVFGDAAAISSEPESAYIRNNGAKYYLSETLCGVIHNPYVSDEPIVDPVARDTTINQIQVLAQEVNIRTGPGTGYSSVGKTVQYGYYNVLSSTTGEGYTWYELGTNNWVANNGAWITYLPAGAVQYTLTITNNTPILGSVIGAGTYAEGNTATIIATPTTDGIFNWWKEGLFIISTEDNEEIVMNSDKTLEVSFSYKPVNRTTSKDQVHIFDSVSALNVRKGAGTSYESIGYAYKGGYYNCYSTYNDGTYTWYKINESPEYWVANNSAGAYLEFLAKDPKFNSKIYIGTTQIKAVALGDLDFNKVAIGSTIVYEKLNVIDYDLIDTTEYSEIDILHSSDVHGQWVDYDGITRGGGSSAAPTFFSYSDIKTCINNLKNNHNIKALAIDTGDYIHNSQGVSNKINDNYGTDAIAQYLSNDYFAAILGNHEFRYTPDHFKSSILDNTNFVNKVLTSCNLFDTSTGKLLFKPYRAAKIGSKKIGFIGASFPSNDYALAARSGINGRDYEKYTWLDGNELYREIQKYIDLFKSNNFDVICCMCHAGDTNYETIRSDSGARSIIQNTSGLDIVFPAHSHDAANSKIYQDKDGNDVLLAAQPRCFFNYLDRVRITDTTITSELIQNVIV